MHYIWIPLLVFVSRVTHTVTQEEADQQVNKDDCSRKFNPLPGQGWDNLREIEMSRALAITYKDCEQSLDGLGIIPDGSYMISKKGSEADPSAEQFNHWDNYTSISSRHMSTNIGFNWRIIAADFSFSKGYTEMKETQFDKKCITTRTQARYAFYAVQFNTPFSVKLHPDLEKACLKAIQEINDGNYKNSEMYARRIIRTYGTHVVMKIDAGASIVKEDYISNAFASKFSANSKELISAASASFQTVLHFGSNTNDQKILEEYKNNTVQANKVYAIGGAPYEPGDDVKQWVDTIHSNLAVIDRTGNPLPELINTDTLKGFNETSITFFQTKLKEAVQLYYELNTVVGCMERGSENFDFDANVPGNCTGAFTNYSFGGMYQTCDIDAKAVELCNPHSRPNILTGGFNCPDNYSSIPLHTLTVSKTYQETVCTFRMFWKDEWCVRHGKVDVPVMATYHTFWCAAGTNLQTSSRFMFGGVYTKDMTNPATNGHNCPSHFTKITVLSGMTVCVTSEFESGYTYSVPFGGFFSCSQGNPFASKSWTWTPEKTALNLVQACPDGYTQHPVYIDNCVIHFCAKSNAFLEARQRDIILLPDAKLKVNKNSPARISSIPIQLLPFNDFNAILGNKTLQDAAVDGNISSNAAVISLIVLVVVGLMIVLIFVVRFRKRKQYLRIDNKESEHLLPDN